MENARAEHHPVRNKSRDEDVYIVTFPISPPRQSSAITGEDISSSTSSTIQQLYECGSEGGPRKRKVAKGGGKPKLRSINEAGELRSKRVFGIQARFLLTAAVECRMFVFMVVWIGPNLVPFVP